MNKEDVSKDTTDLNSALLNLNAFMLEQTEINDHDQLVKTIIDQLDKLFNPVATVYSEYEKQNKLLRIKAVKASKSMLDLVIKIGGKTFFLTTTPVNQEIYEAMTAERVKFVSSLYETFGGAVSKSISYSIDKALNVKGYLGLSFVVDDQIYGTAIIALREEPDSFTTDLLKTYAHFISISLKRVFTEQALRESEERNRAILNTLPDLMFIYSRDGYYLDYHASDQRLLYAEPEQFIGKSIFEVLPQKVAELFLKAFKRAGENNQRQIVDYALDVPGGLKYFEARITLIDEQRLIAIIRDITERKKAEEHIRYISYHDQLTGLYNRHYFEYCKNGLKVVPVVSVIMTDINSLKLVNDIYGHEAGDELLRKYAEHIKKSFKDRDLFFRWGGDEFIIILKNTEEAKSWELCNRLINYCGETFVRDIPLSISVGISSKLGGVDIYKAIKEAEDMMYKNKLGESKRSKIMIMKTLLKTLSGKSFETKEHIDRMTLIGRHYGERLSLPPSELARFETLIMLHDIGKINIDGHILMNKTALTDENWEEIRKHPEVGYRIARTAEEFAYIGEELLAHHERWDGKGYPQGLQGDKIPYLSRILNLIDSYDIMSSGRPYKKKMSDQEIIEEIESCSGKQFDPDLAEKFISFLREEIIKI